MHWLALLEFGHDDVKEELTWSKVNVEKLDYNKLVNLLHEDGIAHSLRPFLWPRFCGATKKKEASAFSYVDVINHCNKDKSSINTEIEKDLSRLNINFFITFFVLNFSWIFIFQTVILIELKFSNRIQFQYFT